MQSAMKLKIHDDAKNFGSSLASRPGPFERSWGLVFFALTMKMNWAGNHGAGFAVSILSLAFGCCLGIWAWLVTFTKLSRKAKP